MSMEPISDSEGLVSIFNSPACTARIQHQGMNIFHVFVAFGRRTLFCYFCMRYYHVRRQLLSNHCNESRSGCKSSILSKEQISVFEKLTFGDIFANEVTPNYLKNQKFFTEHRCAQCTYFSFVFWLKLEIKSGNNIYHVTRYQHTELHIVTDAPLLIPAIPRCLLPPEPPPTLLGQGYLHIVNSLARIVFCIRTVCKLKAQNISFLCRFFSVQRLL